MRAAHREKINRELADAVKTMYDHGKRGASAKQIVDILKRFYDYDTFTYGESGSPEQKTMRRFVAFQNLLCEKEAFEDYERETKMRQRDIYKMTETHHGCLDNTEKGPFASVQAKKEEIYKKTQTCFENS